MIIFNEADRNQTQRYKVRGCEKVIVVRTDAGLPFQLDIETMSQNDPHFRTLNVMTVTSNMDICLKDFPCLACGMDVVFRLSQVDPNSHVFVEILDETCIPEGCCNCN